MQSRFLLDVVIGQSAPVFQLFAGENQSLLIGWDSFFVLNFRLDILDAVRWFHLERDGLSGQGFDEDLHSSSETQNEMKSGLLLDVVVRKRAAILELLACEDEPLLIRRNTFLILNLGLDIFDAVRRLHLEGDSFPRQRLDEDLHSTTKTKNEMKSRFLLNVVIGKSTSVFQLLAGENQPLLIRGNTFLVLDFGLDIFDAI